MSLPRLYRLSTVSSPDAGLYEIDGQDVEFPIKNATVSLSGTQATISISRPGAKDQRIDRLTDATLKGKDLDTAPVELSGVSTYLRDIVGMSEDDAHVTFTLEDFATQQFERPL